MTAMVRGRTYEDVAEAIDVLVVKLPAGFRARAGA